MSNKSSISTILGVAGATVLAAGASAFVTDAGLSFVDRNQAIVQETEAVTEERETELPITVETFASTKDSFTVKPVSSTENKKSSSVKTDTTKKENTDTAESEKSAVSVEGDTSATGTTDGSAAGQSGSSDGSTSSSGVSSDYKVPSAVSYDEWGGWMAANGDYYDGQGGYYDGNGYHYVGDSAKTPSGSSGSSSSSGSSYSGGSGWDDSYILYDVDSHYYSAGDFSGWTSEDLAIARNEIFARHGRIFTTDKWSSYFATKSWYTPRYDNVDDMLNDCEWANLDVIMQLEEQY